MSTPCLVRRQQKDRKWYGKASFWFGLINLLIAGTALYFAYRADSRASRGEEADVRLEARIDPTVLFFRPLAPDWWNLNPQTVLDFGVVQLFVEAKVFNGSAFPIAIDEVRAVTLRGDTIDSIDPLPSVCYGSDYSSVMSYPLNVASHEQKRFWLRVSIPVDSVQRNYLRKFANCGTVSFDAVVEEFGRFSHFYHILDQNMKQSWILPFRDILVWRNSLICAEAVRTNVVIILASGESCIEQVVISDGKCGGLVHNDSSSN